MTAVTACRTCGTELREGARFCVRGQHQPPGRTQGKIAELTDQFRHGAFAVTRRSQRMIRTRPERDHVPEHTDHAPLFRVAQRDDGKADDAGGR